MAASECLKILFSFKWTTRFSGTQLLKSFNKFLKLLKKVKTATFEELQELVLKDFKTLHTPLLKKAFFFLPCKFYKCLLGQCWTRSESLTICLWYQFIGSQYRCLHSIIIQWVLYWQSRAHLLSFANKDTLQQKCPHVFWPIQLCSNTLKGNKIRVDLSFTKRQYQFYTPTHIKFRLRHIRNTRRRRSRSMEWNWLILQGLSLKVQLTQLNISVHLYFKSSQMKKLSVMLLTL